MSSANFWTLYSASFWCEYKLFVHCPECGQAIMMGGPTSQTTCNHCLSHVDLSPRFWKGVMEEGLDAKEDGKLESGALISGSLGGATVNRAWGRRRPQCPSCNADLQAERIPLGQSGWWHCPACGQPTTYYPAPGWLRSVLRGAYQVYCAEPEGGHESAPNESRPILFNCSGCGAGLKFGLETPRITTCEYCHADLYIPDALWRQLHPVRKRAAWYVLYALTRPR